MGATAWVKRHPVITGAIAGGVAGSVVPGLGNVTGVILGGLAGWIIGSPDDEKDKDDD